ncbi:hypothetical protein ACFLUG_02425 [Chloroflexota bacterium]
MNYEYLVNDLQLSGVVVNETGDAFLTGRGNEPVFSGNGKYIRINDEEVSIINVWEYADKESALTEVKFISRDGFNIRKPPDRGNEGFAGHFDWIAPPHWYQSGKVITLYVGDSPDVDKILEGLLGTQFAGQGPARSID